MATRYFVKRIGMAVLVLFVAITFAFILFRLLPGSPTLAIKRQLIEMAQQSGRTVNMERINRQVEVITGVNPDKPLLQAYFEYMYGIIVHQDFGQSIWLREPVFPYLFEKVPWSIFLSVYGLAGGRTIGILLGAGMAYKEGSRFDSGLTIFTIVNRGIPYYFVAIIGLVVFGYILGWFPTAGRAPPDVTAGLNIPFMLGLAEYGFLPITTGIVAGFGGGLAFRGNCVREMGKEYIHLAHLRGVTGPRIAIRYVGRNAILPIYTGLVMGIAGIFGSGIIIETIFTYPAVGYATFRALTQRDYPLLMAAFIFFTTLTVIGILIADLTYGFIDPRVKGGGERESY